MAIYVVVYEPLPGGVSIAGFDAVLNPIGAQMRVLANTWLLRCNLDAKTVIEGITAEIGEGQFLLVAQAADGGGLVYDRLYQERLSILNFLTTQ